MLFQMYINPKKCFNNKPQVLMEINLFYQDAQSFPNFKVLDQRKWKQLADVLLLKVHKTTFCIFFKFVFCNINDDRDR